MGWRSPDKTLMFVQLFQIVWYYLKPNNRYFRSLTHWKTFFNVFCDIFLLSYFLFERFMRVAEFSVNWVTQISDHPKWSLDGTTVHVNDVLQPFICSSSIVKKNIYNFKSVPPRFEFESILLSHLNQDQSIGRQLFRKKINEVS